MCYDISFTTKMETIADYLPELVIDPQINFDFGRAVHVQAQAHSRFPVIVFEHARYQLKPFEWGIIPEYMNTPEKVKKGRNGMCNARREKIVEDKRSYWHRIRRDRCLIPVTGIYEHREVKGWKNKVPYFVHVKGRELFCLPGLYHYPHFADAETGEITGTYTLITRPANQVMEQIHNGGENAFRMPLFLPRELEMKWLLPDLTDAEIEDILAFELPSEALEFHPVFTIRTNKPRPDGREKAEPYEWPGLPRLGEEPSVQTLF
jgi:putative SOS response-associated peptidase YedK